MKLTSAVIIGAKFESSVTVAFVGAKSIDAGSVVTNVGIALAFVDIDTRVTTGR